jgi:hypothetical protein
MGTHAGGSHAGEKTMKVSKEAWRRARADWEATSERSLADVARDLGVAVPTVYARRTREGWKKLFEPQTVAAAAHLRVDAAERILERQNAEFELVVAEKLDLSIDSRVKTINRARADWQEHRELFPLAQCKTNPGLAVKARVLAEMLATRQRGEFLAYGLIEFSGRATDAPIVDETPRELSPSMSRLFAIMEANGGRFPASAYGTATALPPPESDDGLPR